MQLLCFFFKAIYHDEKEMAGKLDVAIYLSLESDPFLLCMKDMKGETINAVRIYPLQAEFQGQKTEGKNHHVQRESFMNKYLLLVPRRMACALPTPQRLGCHGLHGVCSSAQTLCPESAAF
uniref:Uncharacterized protein n=1 Tax=Molossus molossus TaxID=27622 RepID=A0A7J8JXI6_MOLMO|nr:hypothetical protein HJG59_007871 [Molossus molossus]